MTIYIAQVLDHVMKSIYNFRTLLNFQSNNAREVGNNKYELHYTVGTAFKLPLEVDIFSEGQ